MAEISSLEQASPLETLVRRASSRRTRNPPTNLTTPPRSNGSQQAAYPPHSPLLHTQFRSSTTTVNTSFNDYDTSLGDAQSMFSWMDRDRSEHARQESQDGPGSFFPARLRAKHGDSVDVDSQYSYDLDDIAASYRNSAATFRPGDSSRPESTAVPTVVISPGDDIPGDADLEEAFAAAEEAMAVADPPSQGRAPSRVPVQAGVGLNFSRPRPGVLPLELNEDDESWQQGLAQHQHPYSAVSSTSSSSYSGAGTPYSLSAYTDPEPSPYSSDGSQPPSSAGTGAPPSAMASAPPRLVPGMVIPPALMPTAKRPEPRLAPGTFIPPSPFGLQRSNTHLPPGTVVPPAPLPSGIRTAPAVQSFADAPSGPLPPPPESAPLTQPELAPEPATVPAHSPIPLPLPSPASLYSNYSFYQLPPSPNGSTTMLSPHAVPSPKVPSPSEPSPVPTSSRSPTPNGGVNQNPTTPQEWLQLGIQHHEANRLVESAECFERSATLNGGCGVGMLMWGLTQRHGWGCAKSEKAGFKWLRRAAEVAVGDLEQARVGENTAPIRSELVLAIYEVGQSFFRGWGVDKDKKMGVSYFRVAARLGDPDAQQELAFCLANGKGCKKDRKEAAKWYRAAVAQGASEIGLAWIHKEKYQ
ncbi:hypothetical protein CERSUDRAFT_120480 [Gelatoporia subvermispora B]|uniref:HCP-like protein n=1 Tax=Ceriporiopsis subvermispora (strain B) TaxID=914234 RepID=M2PWZ3_CERS8|nr:hypothetical protein CERSUDRAFT_120480 [Gelatoporia subvermispora B]